MADMDTFSIDGRDKDKGSKGYIKKLRKRASSGKVTTQAILRDCLSQGIEVKTGIHFIAREHKTQLCDITTEDLRKTIRSIVIPESQAPPKCLSVLNRAKYNKILHLHIFNCDEVESFFNALSKKIKPKLSPVTVRVHRDSSRVHLLPDRVLSISGVDMGEEGKEEDEVEDEEEQDDKDNDGEQEQQTKNGLHAKREPLQGLGSHESSDISGQVDVVEFNVNGIEDKLEEFIASHSLMTTWKYPLPMGDSGPKYNITNHAPQSKKRKLAEGGGQIIPLSAPSIDYFKTFQLMDKTQAENIIQHLCKVSVKVKNKVDLIADDAVYHDFIETLPFGEEIYTSLGDTHSKNMTGPMSMVAIDCEMCDTEDGLELTRITLLDKYGAVIMDHLVKPHKPILNYRTKYSGIDANKMSNVNTSFEQVQVAFLQIVTKETLLIGHSLDNDLKAIKIVHRRCVDTSILYPHPKGFPYRQSLKYISKEYLKKDIQRNTPLKPGNGHDSVEDAHCALQLAILKGNMGPFFGGDSTEENMRIAYRDVLDEDMSRLAKLSAENSNNGHDGTEIPAGIHFSLLWQSVELFTTYGNSYGNIWAGAYGDVTVPGDLNSTLRECKKRLKFSESSQKSSHAWCFTGLDFEKCIADKEDSSALVDQLTELVYGLDDRVACVFTGQVNLRKAKDLATRKKVCKRAGAKCVATFNQSMEQELKAELAKVNKGYALLF